MTDNSELLSDNDVKKIAVNFLQAKYYQSKIEFGDIKLVTEDITRVYILLGIITMHSRSIGSRLIIPKTADKYHFKIEIDGHRGQINNYEIT